MYIESVNSPADLKKLSTEQLTELCAQIRRALIKKLSEHGGHIGPNLGVVELTVALHYVFNSPHDKIVFDVSHQSYTHKMLTGRKEAFLDKAKYGSVSGYSNPLESEHDFFTIGHTSTSVSLACGLAKARDLKGSGENIIALTGDGSLSGGEAFEGLNNAAEQGTNMIIIVNDNGMSIAENHGGIYENLRLLRETDGKCELNLFKAMGLDYAYVGDGHDMKKLIAAFESVRNCKKPVVVHIRTIKGKGLEYAERNKEHWHWGMPFDIETGKPKFSFDGKGYEELTAEYLLDKMKRDKTVVAVTSGTPTVFGFTKQLREKAGGQFVDVGIAEEHAVALISGIAKNGGKPVYGVYSSFIQRTYDQLSQDLCLNGNPAVILVFAASVFAMNDNTHLGIFDIAMMGNIPNLVYLSPVCREEYFAMLEWGIEQNEHPVAIRVPIDGELARSGKPDTTDYSVLNKFEVVQRGGEVAIIALGNFFGMGREITDSLKKNNINATLINPKFITGLDEELLSSLENDHRLVITIEDGILEGGFGEKIARFYSRSEVKVKNYGIKKSFPSGFDPIELLKENGVSTQQITNDIKDILTIN